MGLKAQLNKAPRSRASVSDFPVSVAKRIVALTREAMVLRISMAEKSTALCGQTDRQTDRHCADSAFQRNTGARENGRWTVFKVWQHEGKEHTFLASY